MNIRNSPEAKTKILSGLTVVLVIFAGIDTRTVDGIASIAGGLPQFHLPDVPLNWEMLKIVLPSSAILAAISRIESLLMLNLVNDMTQTRGKPNRASVGQC